MKRFSITQARALIKRELGFSAAALKKTPGMNGNPQYPWYSMESGNLIIEVYTNATLDGKLIALDFNLQQLPGSVQNYAQKGLQSLRDWSYPAMTASCGHQGPYVEEYGLSV